VYKHIFGSACHLGIIHHCLLGKAVARMEGGLDAVVDGVKWVGLSKVNLGLFMEYTNICYKLNTTP
jgi:hypothetical protein